MRPDFSKIDYKLKPRNSEPVGPGSGAPVWNTAEHIAVKAWYTADDLYAMEHLNYAAGVAPFLVIDALKAALAAGLSAIGRGTARKITGGS